MQRSTRRAPHRADQRHTEAAHRLLHYAGFVAHQRHPVWVHATRRKIISEPVLRAINLTQLRCWIERPAHDGGWSTWFQVPLRPAVLDTLLRDCAQACQQ